MFLRLIALFSALILAAPVSAQDYGGGWAVPSLDTASMIGQQVVASELGVRAAGGMPGRGTRAAIAPSGSVAAPTHLFAASLQPNAPAAEVNTRFTRSKAVQKNSEATLLSKLRERNPAAVGDFQRYFAQYDMAADFNRSQKDFRFSANDAADTLSAYWLMAWVVANGADDIPVPAARAVRDQVARGMARTAVGSYPPAKMQQLADEAIFNLMVLTQLYHYTAQGKISKADYARLGEATQKAFLGLGTDLRGLRLTDAGFAQR